jgi:hypothetical protein
MMMSLSGGWFSGVASKATTVGDLPAWFRGETVI